MGRPIAVILILANILMIGLALTGWPYQKANAQQCFSPPEVMLALKKQVPELKDGVILQNENLVVFMKKFTEDIAGGAIPPFSFGVVYIFNDPSDDTIGVYFFHQGCFQWRGWFPSQLINPIIQDVKNG